jgi:GNAT superfamily N-acetyltransferase
VGTNLFGLETHVRPLGSRFLHAAVVPTDDGQYLSTIEVESESGVVYRRALRFASSEQAHIDLTSQLHLMNEISLEDLQRCAEQTVEDDEPFAFGDHREHSRLAGIGDMGKLSPFGEQLQSEVPGSEVELRVKPLNQERQIVDLENLFVPKDQRNQGVGSGYMERIVRWADENNVWLTLSLADKNKERGTTSSTRLEKFYRQFGFVPNRGRHKDFALSLYTNMYRAPKAKAAAEQDGEFDTHVPTSIDDPRPKLHYLSRKLAMTKSGYWINYQTGTEVGVGEHEMWLRNPQNAQMIGVPPQIVADFDKFEPVKDRDALLRYVMQHAPIMRVRGHGREISFEYSSSRSKGPLDAVWTWAEREAGPLTSLFIANLATGETTSMLYKDFVETMNNSGYEGIMRRASREVANAGA